jgi:hypothetical protein
MLRSLLACFIGVSICADEKVAPPDISLFVTPQEKNFGYVSADFIYWVADEQGNNFASTGAAIRVPGTTDPNTGLVPGLITGGGNLYSPEFKIKPGFKVAVGGTLMHNEWNIFAEYTYLYSNAKNSVSSDNLNTGILPLFSYAPNNAILASTTYATTSGATGFVSSASASWLLHFNNINFEVEKNFLIYKDLVLHPHFGLQGSWQIEHFNALYVVNSTTSLSTVNGSNSLKFEQKFWGVGPRIGLDGTWQCCNHFGLFANTGLSALWSRFNDHATSYDTNATAGYTNVEISNQYNRFNTLIPVTQLLIGAQTDWTFNDRYRFLLQAGWETQMWFFMNQHSSTIADISLNLQGFTLRAALDF